MALRDVLLSIAQTPHRLRRRALVTWTPTQELNEVRDRSGARMKRRLEWYDLVGLGVGGMLGAGVFVTTGRVARDTAGPAVFASYVVAGVSALLSSLCYAEFSVRVPVAGGAFSYLRVTFGRLIITTLSFPLAPWFHAATVRLKGRRNHLNRLMKRNGQIYVYRKKCVHVLINKGQVLNKSGQCKAKPLYEYDPS